MGCFGSVCDGVIVSVQAVNLLGFCYGAGPAFRLSCSRRKNIQYALLKVK